MGDSNLAIKRRARSSRAVEREHEEHVIAPFSPLLATYHRKAAFITRQATSGRLDGNASRALGQVIDELVEEIEGTRRDFSARTGNLPPLSRVEDMRKSMDQVVELLKDLRRKMPNHSLAEGPPVR